MKKQYFTFISHSYVLTNLLQKAVLKLLEDNSRSIIGSVQLKAFKKYMITEIQFLNKKFPNCKPLDPYWDEDSTLKDSKLCGLPGICNFYIYGTKAGK